MGYLLGFDVGTTGTKALLIDETGKIVARATVEYPLSTPQPNWAEQDPGHWWQATIEATGRVLAEADISGEQVDAVGLAGSGVRLLRPALL